MVSDVQSLGDIRLYERLNEQLSKENERLHLLLREERELNRMLLRRFGMQEKVTEVTNDYQPIGGYTSLSEKIKDAEKKSREEWEKAEGNKSAS